MRYQSYLLRMSASLLTMGGMGVFFAPSLGAIFLSNPWLNTLILALTFSGVMCAFYQIYRLKNNIMALEDLKQNPQSAASFQEAIFLEPILSLVYQNKRGLSPSLARGLAHSLADRLESERVFPRYLIGLLVFLGLLGTFWGLSQTITSIAHLIQHMPSSAIDSANFFHLLKESLQSPLTGMGTAFSSSLFGLGGSLLVGFLELQVGHAYGRFLNEVDFYLTASSHQNDKGLDSPSASLHFLQALLTRNVESMDQLIQLIEKSEKNDRQTSRLLDKLIPALTLLTEQNKTHQNLMVKLAEGQIHLQSQLSTLSSASLDEESRKHLQNIDRMLAYSLQNQRESREEFLKKLRDEMRLIAHTMASLGEEQRLVS
jgi:hypothetical protein